MAALVQAGKDDTDGDEPKMGIRAERSVPLGKLDKMMTCYAPTIHDSQKIGTALVERMGACAIDRMEAKAHREKGIGG